MFFVVRSNDSFNFPLGLTKYIVTVIVVVKSVLQCDEGNNCWREIHLKYVDFPQSESQQVTEMDRQTDGRTDRRTNRRMDSQTDRQTDR